MIRRSIFAALPLGLLAFASSANTDLVPLQEAIADGAEPSYQVVRCAAFHLATAEWIGRDMLGPERFDATISRVGMQTVEATQLRSAANGADPTYTLAQVQQDIREIADLYRSRFESNYRATGKAFENDPVWTADLSLCAYD